MYEDATLLSCHCERSEAIPFSDRDCFVTDVPRNDRIRLLVPFSEERRTHDLLPNFTLIESDFSRILNS